MKRIELAIIALILCFVSCKKQDKQIEVPKVEETQQVKEEILATEVKPVEKVKPNINECYSETELPFNVNWGYEEEDSFGYTKYKLPTSNEYINAMDKVKSIKYISENNEMYIYSYEKGLLMSWYNGEPKSLADPLTYFDYDKYGRLQKKYNLNSENNMYNVEEFSYYVDSENNIVRFNIMKNHADSAFIEKKTSEGYRCEYYVGNRDYDLRTITPKRMQEYLHFTIDVYIKDELIVKVVNKAANYNSISTTVIDYSKDKVKHMKTEEYYNENISLENEYWYRYNKEKCIEEKLYRHNYEYNTEIERVSSLENFDEYGNWSIANNFIPKENKTEISKREITYYE